MNESPAGGGGERARHPVVGLGASAGGLEALQAFFSHLPAQTGLGFVVVQHLAPDQPSMLVELLAAHSAMPVVEATDGTRAEADRVYVIAPGTLLTLEDGAFRVAAAVDETVRAPVDAFFRSLAEDQRDRAVGIVLSGAGHDGTAGLRAIKERGGLTLAQCPKTAKHDSMPESAIEAGLVDHILSPALMPGRLLEHADYIMAATRQGAATLEAELESSLAKICALIRRHTGHDFGRYKEGTLLRRIRRRMQLLHVESVDDYVELLSQAQGEAQALLKDLLIGVTYFFRDPECFQALAQQVVPRITQGKAEDAPIRIWVPGCASGEEAYSLAILVREHLERLGTGRFVQIFATDLDAEMLAEARQGRYSEEIAEQVSPGRLARFFARDGRTYQAVKELREMCIFSEHSLIRDPPFSQLDLVSCRNVLIYLSSDLQKRLVPLFHYALRPGGFLFLGPSEGIAGSPELFETTDKRSRIFRRKETMTRPVVEFPLTGRGSARPAAAPLSAPVPRDPDPPTAQQKLGAAFERALRDEYTFPSAVINERGEALYVAGPISRYLQLPAGPAATPNLLEALRGGLRHELRTALRAARRRKVVKDDIRVDVEDVMRRVRLIVRPMPAVGPEAGLFLVVIQEGGSEPADAESGDVEAEEPAVEQLEDELRTTRAELKTTVEELEGTNEELKSSNEELISTNEELQSANEELQTSKEELQSLNEELETVNTELRQKVDELATANSDLLNLFAATEIATIFLDRSLRVMKFTPAATALFRLIGTDVGRPLADLAPRFAGQDLVADAERVLGQLSSIERQVQSADGTWFVLRVLPYRTIENVIAGVIVTFVDISAVKRAEQAARQQAELVHLSHDAIFVRRLDGRIESWNRGAQELYGFGREEAIGKSSHDLLRTVFPEPLHEIEAALRHGGSWVGELEHRTKDGRTVTALSSMQLARGDDGVDRILEANRDITERRATEHRLAYLASFPERNENPVVEVDLEGCVRYANPAALSLFPDLLEQGAAHPWLDWEPGAVSIREGNTRASARSVTVDGRNYHQSLLFVPEQGVVRVYGLDVTEQKQAEAERDRLAAQRQLALDAARMGWWHYDPATQIATWDDRYQEIFGVTGHQSPNDEILARLHPDDLPGVWAAVEAALDPKDPQPYATQYRVNRPDGTVWVEAHGLAVFEGEGDTRRATSFVGTVADITARKQAELENQRLFAAVREEKERLSALVGSIRDEVWFCDLDKQFTLANPAAVQEFELAPEVGTDVEAFARDLEVLRPDGSPRPVEEAPPLRALAGETIASQEEIVRTPATGELRHREVSASPVRDAAGRIIGSVSVVRDITERKRAEQELKASEERFRALAANADDAIARFDRAGRYVYVNPFVARVTGLPAEAIIGRTVEELGRNVGTESFEARLREVFDTGQPLRFDRRSVDGRWYDVQLMPERRGAEVETALVISRDITERKRVEAALRESEERYRSLFSSLLEGFCIIEVIFDSDLRPVDYRVLELNPAFEAQTGLHDAQDRLMRELAPDHEPHWFESYGAVALTGRPARFVSEASALGRWYDVSAYRVGGAESRKVAILFNDITERKRAEIAAEEANLRLRAANEKLAEADQRKNEFLAMLSHELRNPLTPVSNSLYVLERAAPGSEQARHAQAVIGRQVEQLARLVDDLLDVTRITRNKIHLQRRPLDLNDLVLRTIEDHRSLFEAKRVRLETRLSADPLPISGDDARLAQVVGNLLQNAAKFTPAGGEVSVSTAAAAARGRVALWIVDTGVGIEPTMLGRLFQPFMQADATLDRSMGGLGLGLALVKGLVELHGGEVCAHSDGPGHGTQFVVELPLDARAADDESPSELGTKRPSRRVLIIEDNIDAADSLRGVLELDDHVVDVAHNGPEGLARARDFGPEIVLCDIGLPGMDGYEVARAFRADDALKSVHLVALSGYALPEDLRRAHEVGFERHLAKPPSPDKLAQLLATLTP
jgi:two-component system, chemotaxis family, CheB/CheR fusion protein